MQHTTEFIGIMTALAIGTISPGPSFVLVARTAVSTGRFNGFCTAMGMGIGALTFALVCLLGLHGILLLVPSLYLFLKIGGGLYLMYLGVSIWRRAHRPLGPDIPLQRISATSSFKYLMVGLLTQVSNPKTAIVYASVFAAFLPLDATYDFKTSLVLLLFFMETGWYALVAAVLSSSGPQHVYLRAKKWIDRTAGGVMIALGLKLATSHDTL